MRGASYLSDALQHVKFATRTNQVRTVFSRNFFECLQPEISSFLLSRVDITGLQIINSATSHGPRLVLPISLIVTVNFGSCLMITSQTVTELKLWVATNFQDLIQFHQSTSILL